VRLRLRLQVRLRLCLHLRLRLRLQVRLRLRLQVRLRLRLGCGCVWVAVAVAGTYQAFLRGDWVTGIVLSLFALMMCSFAYGLLFSAINEFKNAIGTDFSNANLTRARFTRATIDNADFSGANCDYVDWTNASCDRCKLLDSLKNEIARKLYVKRQGRGQKFVNLNLERGYLIGVDLVDADLEEAYLNGADLSRANLTNANLIKAKAHATNFSGANLTGACIANWGINPDTKFDNVICDYIYIDSQRQERKPASGEFAAGDFANLVTIFTQTLDFLFKNGIDSQAFDSALQQMLDHYNEYDIHMKAVEEVGNGDRLVKFEVASDAPKAEIHANFERNYQTKISKDRMEEKEYHSKFLEGFVYHQSG